MKCEEGATKEWTVGSTANFDAHSRTAEGADDIPIEWDVPDEQDDRALLISKYALDHVQYKTVNTSVTMETCSLRAWLNNPVINKKTGCCTSLILNAAPVHP